MLAKLLSVHLRVCVCARMCASTSETKHSCQFTWLHSFSGAFDYCSLEKNASRPAIAAGRGGLLPHSPPFSEQIQRFRISIVTNLLSHSHKLGDWMNLKALDLRCGLAALWFVFQHITCEMLQRGDTKLFGQLIFESVMSVMCEACLLFFTCENVI